MYDVPLRVLSITPTRDGTVNPSRRLPDKHVRKMCGKTLDEWTMLQLWSSKHVSRIVFVCETEKHRERLAPLAEKYGVDLMVRSPELLHPQNDSGALVMFEALTKIIAEQYYTLLMTPFVITPVRPPGFLDRLIEFYIEKFSNPDNSSYPPYVTYGNPQPVRTQWVEQEDGRAINATVKYHGRVEFNSVIPSLWETSTEHWVCPVWYYFARSILDFTRMNISSIEPFFLEAPEWTEVHIDTEDDWDYAEFWLQKKILSQGEDCYEKYRESWS